MNDYQGQPVATIKAGQAVAHSRALVASGTTAYHRLCLGFVRECWQVPYGTPTAIKAWENAQHKHPFTHVDDIPYGAPVFTQRPNAGPDDAGHVLLAGGINRHGIRVFRSTDILIRGGISVCRLRDIVDQWGHRVLGWTGDLNGVWLNLPPAPSGMRP